jgi:hypothetical protein
LVSCATSYGIVTRTVKRFEEWLACVFQPFFKPGGAIAISAGPGLGTILVAALAAVVRVLHLDQLKILLPIRSLFLERCRAIADFDPSHRLVSINPRFVHVAQVLVSSDRASAQCAALNRFLERPLATIFHPRSHEVSHVFRISVPRQPL